MRKTDEEWKEKLTPEQYHVMREKGTEKPFSGRFYNSKNKGMYVCAACGNKLFLSDDKFSSGTGWPSYTKPAEGDAVTTASDDSLGMRRTEVTCSGCGGHLGHVFDDGLAPGGKRYCINSCALNLKKEEK